MAALTQCMLSRCRSLAAAILYLSAAVSGSLNVTLTSFVVTFPDGEVAGELVSPLSGTHFLRIRGIQYAEHPVGELRFQPSIDMPPWTDVKDGSRFGPDCINAYHPPRTRTRYSRFGRSLRPHAPVPTSALVSAPLPAIGAGSYDPSMAGFIGRLLALGLHAMSEACLFLNIWAPPPGRFSESLPVRYMSHTAVAIWYPACTRHGIDRSSCGSTAGRSQAAGRRSTLGIASSKCAMTLCSSRSTTGANPRTHPRSTHVCTHACAHACMHARTDAHARTYWHARAHSHAHARTARTHRTRPHKTHAHAARLHCRLGALGFLGGNFGLQDTRAALRWVRHPLSLPLPSRLQDARPLPAGRSAATSVRSAATRRA